MSDISKVLTQVVLATTVTDELPISKITPYVVKGAASNEAEASKVVAYIVTGPPPTIGKPRIHTWTFTLDDHDFLVVQLPAETLVYDFAVGKWYDWGSGTEKQWTAQIGANWNADIGGLLDTVGGTKVTTTLCGDRETGAVYFLDPEAAEDSVNDPALTTTLPFQRLITGLVTIRGHTKQPCYGVQVTGSLGKTTGGSLADVTLYTSDDAGVTFDAQGTVTTSATSLENRLEWRSLGSITSPGRLFRLEDFGALTRVDGLEMQDGPTPR